MTDGTRPHDPATIHDLLRTAFTAKALCRFCWDRPAFRPILSAFSDNPELNDLVDKVVTYCEKQVLFDELLAAIRRYNPEQYARFEPRLQVPVPAKLYGADVSPVQSPILDLDQLRADYFASLRLRLEYLDLGGIAPRAQNRTIRLRMADVFVPLQACPALEARAGWAVDEAAWARDETTDRMEADAKMAPRMPIRNRRPAEATPVDISDLLKRPRVVLLGNPGCGKSTLLRHVAYGIATGDAKTVGEEALARLPILVHIAQYAPAHARYPALTLDTYLRRACEPRWAPLFQRALDDGEALVLLDGLDEVADARQRRDIAAAIQTLAADCACAAPGCVFLVTSRIVDYQAARLNGDFTHYTVQPLPPERSTEFVEKWYAAIGREAQESALRVGMRERAEALSCIIQEQPGIRRLAENPLLLTIIALVNWRGGKLPNHRVELCAHAAEALIDSWPYRRQGVVLDAEHVIRLLSPAAYCIFVSHGSSIAEDALLPVLRDAICHVDGVDEFTAEAYAREFLGQVGGHSGIFREQGYDGRGQRVLGFLHQTFAEYFTARHLAGMWEGLGADAGARRAFLHRYAHVPRWREVMLLLAGEVGLRDNDGAERATSLLGDILQLGSECEVYLHRDLLLAGACLADDLRVQPQAAQYVLDRLLDRIPEQGIGEAIQDILCPMHATVYGKAVLAGLLARLEDQDWAMRGRAAETLGRIGDAGAVTGLLARLEDKDWAVRGCAAEALGRIGDVGAVSGLLARLEDEEPSVRRRAAEALGHVGGVGAVIGLLARLESANPAVQELAAEALGRIGDVGAVTDLLVRLKEKDPARWWRAVEGQGRIAIVLEGLLARLANGEPFVRGRAAWVLGRIGGARASAGLLARLKDESWYVRGLASAALGRIGDAGAVTGLLARLEDKAPSVRGFAAEALGHIGDTGAVVDLLTLLEDGSPLVRGLAAEALGRIAAAASADLLTRLEDKDPVMWWRAAETGEYGGDTEAAADLLARLRERDPVMWWYVMEAQGLSGDAVLAGLLARLEDEASSVRELAVWALGRIGDVGAVAGLLARLEDEASSVRGRAAEALGRIGDARAVAGLLTRLKDEEPFVRGRAAKALGRIGDMRAVPGLLGRLEDEASSVRELAAWALGCIGDARAVVRLLVRLEDEEPFVRGRAAEALGRIADARATAGLLTRLEDEAWYVRGRGYTALMVILNHNVPEPEPEATPFWPRAMPGPWDE